MKSLPRLFIPIALETLCFMLAGMADTVMLPTVGGSAVGAYIALAGCRRRLHRHLLVQHLPQYACVGRQG